MGKDGREGGRERKRRRILRFIASFPLFGLFLARRPALLVLGSIGIECN